MAVLLQVLLLAVPRAASAADVTLAWDPNNEPELAGYSLHYGFSSGNYSFHEGLEVIGKATTFTVTGLDPGTRYFFAVRAHDGRGNASGYSNEVEYTPPAPESVSRPSPPEGPTTVQAGVAYVFRAGGAVSSTGDAVEYRFLWSDGTDSGWLLAGTVEAVKSWTVPAEYTDVRVEARCAAHPQVASGLSDPVAVSVLVAPGETVSQPAAPAGPATVAEIAPHAYTTGGAASSAGHPLEYRFLWADGSVSPWVAGESPEASHGWGSPGTYAVRAEARCALHPGVRSTPSAGTQVRVQAATGEAIAEPSPPAGPGDARTGIVYGFDAGGAATPTGDPLEYRVHWGDGTVSPWLAPGASDSVRAWKSWARPGVYSIIAEARCALHPGSSALSGAFAVSVAGGASLLIADSFSDGTEGGDPQWRTVSGKWTVGADKTFTAVGTRSVNRAVVEALPAFKAGRIATKLRLTRGSLQKATGIIFAFRDARHYRYVALSGSRLVLGQVGDTPGTKGGVKAAASRTFRADQWHALRVDVRPDGRVAVYLGTARKPVLTHRFADPVAGRVGCLAQQSVAHFDDFRAWDARALR